MSDGSINIDTKIDTKQFEKDMKGMQDKMKTGGKALTDTGKTMSKNVTAPIVALGGLAFASANEIDKAYNNIRIGTGLTGDELRDLENTFDDVFTQVPQGPDEVSTVLADLNTMMGFTGDEAGEMGKQILDASRMMGEDSATLTQQSTEAFNRWGVETEDAAEKMDFMFQASQDTGMGMSEMFGFISQHASTLEGFGMNMEESAYFVGELEKAGYDTSGMMREMRTGLTKLAEDGQDPIQAFGELSDRIKDAEDSTEAAEIASEVFGSRAGDVAEAIRDGNFDLDAYTDSMDDHKGAIQETSEETLTTAERFAMLKDEIMVALKPVGDMLIQFAEEVLPKVIERVKQMAEWWDNLSPTMQRFITITLLVLAAIGPLLVIIGMVIGALANIIPVVVSVIKIIGIISKVFVVFLNPISWIIAIVGVLAYVIFKYWDEIKEFTLKVFSWIGDFLSDLWQSIRDTITNLVTGIRDSVTDTFNNLRDRINTIFSAIRDFFTNIWDRLKSIAQGAVTWIRDTVGNVFQSVRDRITTIFTGIRDFFSGLWDNITGRVSTFVEKFVNLFDGIKSGVQTALSPVITFINGIISAIESMVNAVGRGINSLPSFDVPDWLPDWAGGGASFGFPDIPNISIPRVPSLDVGTDRVMADGLAMIHKGEQVVPADVAGGGYNGGSNQPVTVIVELDGRQIAKGTAPHMVDLIRLKTGMVL